jgi:hypothetical protein
VKLEKQPNIEAVHAQLSNQFGDRVTNARAVRESHGGSEAYHPSSRQILLGFLKALRRCKRLSGFVPPIVVPIVPFGAGTSLEGNASSPRGGVCLDMMKMNRSRASNSLIALPRSLLRDVLRRLRVDNCTGLFGRACIGYCDVRTVACQAQCYGRANAATSTCYKRNSAFEARHSNSHAVFAYSVLISRNDLN